MIYTKKGDRGQTGLFDGRRVAKNDAVIEAIGAVDELNATIGAATVKLTGIQNDLFAVGSQLAGYKTKVDLEARTKWLEAEIDRMWKEMPPLTNFILPRGQLHLARSVCRRAERALVAVSGQQLADSLKYLNRLSDYLFCLARYVNYQSRKPEVVWKA
ncbi:cob(I)yrinic acid a,c-diamide adenosyltransferase [Candidatus Microgenomates bacterium]|nr:cob(I)yrinic acid a,c-diamide adenosyltransferase [Candidatus Microgenomates bacterium]